MWRHRRPRTSMPSPRQYRTPAWRLACCRVRLESLPAPLAKLSPLAIRSRHMMVQRLRFSTYCDIKHPKVENSAPPGPPIQCGAAAIPKLPCRHQGSTASPLGASPVAGCGLNPYPSRWRGCLSSRAGPDTRRSNDPEFSTYWDIKLPNMENQHRFWVQSKALIRIGQYMRTEQLVYRRMGRTTRTSHPETIYPRGHPCRSRTQARIPTGSCATRHSGYLTCVRFVDPSLPYFGTALRS
jgi:hypothetical protein